MKKEIKTAVITGISRGIGLALAQKLLSEGYYVIGTTRSGKFDEITYPNFKVVALEVTDQESIKQATEKIVALTDGIDLLVNNAGIALDNSSTEPELASFNQTMAINVTGPIFFTEPLLDLLKEGSQVIFVSSAYGLHRNADEYGPAYRVSKAAVNMYAVMLAKRLAPRQIRVTPMHPGWVQTRLGGNQAPLTPAQSADGLYHGITTNTESGKFWNIDVPGIEAY